MFKITMLLILSPTAIATDAFLVDFATGKKKTDAQHEERASQPGQATTPAHTAPNHPSRLVALEPHSHIAIAAEVPYSYNV